MTRLLSRVPRRPAQAAAPRPRPGGSAAGRAGTHVGAGADPGRAGAGRRRGARARRRRLGGPVPAVGAGGTPCVRVASRRPRRPARRGRRLAPTWGSRGCRGGPALVRVLQWLLILAARRWGSAGSPRWRSRRTSRRRCPTRSTWGRCRCRRCCCSGVSRSGCCWRWSAGCWSGSPRATGPRPPTSGCARRSRRLPRSWSIQPVEAELTAYTAAREGLVRGPAVGQSTRAAPARKPSTAAGVGDVLHRAPAPGAALSACTRRVVRDQTRSGQGDTP